MNLHFYQEPSSAQPKAAEISNTLNLAVLTTCLRLQLTVASPPNGASCGISLVPLLGCIHQGLLIFAVQELDAA